MIQLDMLTLVTGFIVTDLIIIIIMLILWRQNRRHFEGSLYWVIDFSFQTIALILIALRGSIPDWISMVMSNSLVIGGTLLGLIGLERFAGIRGRHFYNYLLLIAFIFCHFWFSLVNPDLPARNLNLASAFLILSLQICWLVAVRLKGELRRMTLSIGLVFLLYSIINIARIVNYFTSSHPGNDYFKPNPFESYVLIAYQMLFILLTYSLALMFNKRLLYQVGSEKEKFSVAFHSSPYAIIITRLTDGKIFEVNKGFEDISGFKSSDIIGLKTNDLNLWYNEEERTLLVSELSLHGKVYDKEFQFRKKSGELMTCLMSAEIITINSEKCVMSSINDITERKKIEDLLKESQTILKAAMDNSPSGIAIADAPDGKLRYVNKAGLMIPAKSEEEIVENIDINKYVASWNIKHHDGTPYKPDEVPLARAVLYGETNSREFIISRDDMDDRVVLANAAPILDDFGKVKAGIVVFQDITDYKRAEELISQQYFTLKGLNDSSKSPIFSVDTKYCYTSFNKTHSSVMKHIYNVDIEIGMSLLDCMTNSDDKSTAKKNIDRALKGEHYSEEAFSGEAGLARIFFEVTHNPIFNDNSEVIGVAVLARDLTQRKVLEIELNSKITELEKFNKIMVGRELKMVDLKQEINELCVKLKLPARYKTREDVIK